MESTNGMALMNVGRAGRFAFNRTALRSSVNKQFERRKVADPPYYSCPRDLILKGVECAKPIKLDTSGLGLKFSTVWFLCSPG